MTVKSRRQPVRSWQQLIEIIDSRQPREITAALREREKRLTESWKNHPPREMEALAWLMRSDHPIKDIAVLLRQMHRPRRRSKPGKPGGRHLRWQRPHYLVAWLVESWPHAKRTDVEISSMISTVNSWHLMQGKRPLDPEPSKRDHDRVKTLLRESKDRRL